jgi:hypothetical protein
MRCRGSYRDDKAIAIGSAEYAKEKNPTVEVTVRDLAGRGRDDRHPVAATEMNAAAIITLRDEPLRSPPVQRRKSVVDGSGGGQNAPVDSGRAARGH